MSPVPGEPRESPRPEPIGNISMIILFTACTVCGLFLLWRRADSLRRVVSHQLKTLTRSEGQIRLSEDEGPAANEFLADDFDDDNHLHDDEPLAQQLSQASRAWREPTNLLHNYNGAEGVRNADRGVDSDADEGGRELGVLKSKAPEGQTQS